MSVCLSVCLLARLLENACIDLHEKLHVDRRTDLTFEPDLDYSPYAGTGLLSLISYKRSYAEFPRIRIGGPAAARCGFKIVIFTESLEHLCQRYMHSTECHSSFNYNNVP